MNIMSIEFKDYAKDIKLNLSSILKTDPESSLNNNQIFIISLASSYATKNQNIVDEILERGSKYLSEEDRTGAKEAATIMGMNNIYYRFIHLVSDQEYTKIPAKLRMNIIGKPSISKVDFELASLAVSAINGCGMCIDSHVKQLEQNNINKKSIQHSIRIASVINAASQAEFIN